MAQNGSNKPSFSLSLGAKKVAAPFVKPSPFASIAPKRRTGFESDSDTEEPTTKPQLLSGFDAEKGALSLNPQDDETKGPIVIPRLQNRDWRAESRKKKGLGYIPDQEQRAQADSGGPQVFENGPQAYGLQFVEKKDDVPVATSEDPSRTEAPAPQTEERVSEDQAAIKALLAGDKEKRRSDLVLAPIDTENDWRASRPANEDDAYRMDVESRPDVASLEAYEAIPVEEFGAALLRGMGWKDGEGIGRNKAGGVKEVIRRPAFLGIGAKSKEVAMGEELGAWGKGAKKRNPRLDKTYVPVVKVNKRTGEVIKEDMEVEQKRRREEEPRPRAYSRPKRND
ncbi:DNA primase large subunit Spp2 [Saitoella coloradoensis]